jgi:hypothetical protein
MKKNRSQKRLPWWPAPPENGDLSNFLMSLAFLVLTYFMSVCFFVMEQRYISLGVLVIHFVLVAFDIYPAYPSEEISRAQQWQAFVQQALVAVLLVSPLIWMHCKA